MNIKSFHTKLALLGILMANTAYAVTTIPINGGLTGCRFYVPQDPAVEEQRGRIYYDREALSVDGNALKRRDQNTKPMPVMFALIKVSQGPSYDEYVAVQEGTNHRCFAADGYALSNGMRTFNLYPRLEGCEAAKADPNLRWSTTWAFEPAFENYYNAASQRATRFLYQDFGKLHLWSRTGGASLPITSLGNSLAMLGDGRLGGNTQNPVPTPGLECSGVRTPSDVQGPSNNIEPGERAFERALLPVIENGSPRPQHYSVRDPEMGRLFNRALSTFGNDRAKVMSVAIQYGARPNLPPVQRADEAINRTIAYWQAMDQIRPAMEIFAINNAPHFQNVASKISSSRPAAAIDSAQQRLVVNKEGCDHLTLEDQSWCAVEQIRRRILRRLPDNSNNQDLLENGPSSGAAYVTGASIQGRIAMPQGFFNNTGGVLGNAKASGLNLRCTYPYRSYISMTNSVASGKATNWFGGNYFCSIEITSPKSLSDITGWTTAFAEETWAKVIDKSISSGLEFHFFFNGLTFKAFEVNVIFIDLNLKGAVLTAMENQFLPFVEMRRTYEMFAAIYSSQNPYNLVDFICSSGRGGQVVRVMCRSNRIVQDLSRLSQLRDGVSQAMEDGRMDALAAEVSAASANVAAAIGVDNNVVSPTDIEVALAANSGQPPAGERTWFQYYFDRKSTSWFGESHVPIVELSWRTRWQRGQAKPVSTAAEISYLHQNRMNLVRNHTDNGKAWDVHLRHVYSNTARLYFYADWNYMKENVFNVNNTEAQLANVVAGR